MHGFGRRLVGGVVVSAAIMGLAGSAFAANPKIHGFDPAEVVANGVLAIEGADFSDVAADVKVRIGNEDAIVVAATFDRLTVFVPNLPLGEYEVVVSLGAARSREAVTVRIVDTQPVDGLDGGIADPGTETVVPPPKLVELNLAHERRDAGAVSVEFNGTAKVPDGCVIVVSLKLDDRFMTSVRAKVRGGRFQGKIGPFARQLFAGNYAVEAEFSLRGQPSRIVRQFNKAYPDPKVRGALERAFDRVYARMGTVQDERSDMTRIRKHFDGQLRRVTELLADLDDGFCTTGRSIFRTGDGAVQEVKWEEWLKKRSLRGLGEERFRKKAGKLAKERSYLSGKNFFDDVAWRGWLDDQWRGDVIQLAKSHVKFRDRWAAVKHPEAVDMLDEALAVLIRLSQRRSQELYTKNDLPVHANDKAVKGADVLQLASGGVASPARIRGLIRKVRKELGLQSR